jgi:dTMP kinase
MKMADSSIKKGFFITFEGGEGAGKTTLLNKLAYELQQLGCQVVVTREPGGTKLGESIRHLLLTQQSSFSISSRAELLLFLSARAQHLDELIIPSLKQGKIVLCDRFNDSTLAYQGEARGLKMGEVEALCRLVCQDVQPDLTFFLDLDPKIGLARTQKISKEHAASGQLDRIEAETVEFHERVQRAFQEIARNNRSRVVTIDASQPAEFVQQQAWQILKKCIQSG